MAPLSPAAVFAPRSDIPPLAAAVLRPPGREPDKRRQGQSSIGMGLASGYVKIAIENDHLL